MSRQSSGVHPQGGDRVLPLVSVAGGVTIALQPETHANRLLTLSTLGSAYTLNLPRAYGTGDEYEFLSTGARTSGSIVINASAALPSNFFVGTIWQHTASTDTLVQFSSTVNDIITLNNTTTGGAGVGDYLRLVDAAPDTWRVVWGFFTTSGNPATPFSG